MSLWKKLVQFEKNLENINKIGRHSEFKITKPMPVKCGQILCDNELNGLHLPAANLGLCDICYADKDLVACMQCVVMGCDGEDCEHWGGVRLGDEEESIEEIKVDFLDIDLGG